MAARLIACLCVALLAPASAACAQEGPATASDDAAITPEEPDPTRLDVERLPPEAIEITRALYAHGFFIEAALGGRGFANGIGEVSNGGPWASIGIGFEIVDWLMVIIAAEGSMHETSAPRPPATSVFELLGGSASLRLQGNFTEAFAMWISAQFAVLVASTDQLALYGYQDASTIGIAYGGEAGIDWHLRARHYSLGLLGGVRHYPSLEAAGGPTPALGVHGAAYLRYVF